MASVSVQVDLGLFFLLPLMSDKGCIASRLIMEGTVWSMDDKLISSYLMGLHCAFAVSMDQVLWLEATETSALWDKIWQHKDIP